MTKPPMRRRSQDPFSVAEAAFKSATTPPPLPDAPPRKAGLPITKEPVSIRLDSDVLAFFQDEGPGWQDRVNAALRKAAGL